MTPATTPAFILPAKVGAWDVTQYPFGGDFIRPSVDTPVRNVRPSHKDGWMLCECEYPNRKGVRTICTNGIIEAVRVTVTRDEFGTFYYEFRFQESTFQCFDFPSDEEAHKGAEFHLHCLRKNLPHEVCDGIGAIYRPDRQEVQP